MRRDKRRDDTIGDARDESRQNVKRDDKVNKMRRDETRRDREEKINETRRDETKRDWTSQETKRDVTRRVKRRDETRRD